MLGVASRLRTLRELSLVDMLLREEVAVSFERMLRDNRSIESLELIRNCVENDEFAISACKLLPGLRRFVYDNLLYDEAVDQVAKLMENENCVLEELRITRCFKKKWAGSRLATALGKNATVTFLLLKACYLSSDVGAEFARALEKNRCLQRLDFSYCQMDGKGLSLLAKAFRLHNRTLQRLDMEAVSVWPDHCILLLDAMVENETLTKLNLGYLRGRDGILEASEAIAARGLQHRIHLGLGGVVMEEALYELDAVRLLYTVTSLTVNIMGVYGMAMYSRMLFRFASLSKVLKVLKVNIIPLVYTDTCESLMDFLRSTTTVETLHIDSVLNNLVMVDGVLLAMAENRTIVEWVCYDCRLYSKALPALLYLLRNNKTLAHVEVPSNLSTKEYGEIAAAIPKTLLHLNTGNKYEDFGVNEVLRQNVLRMNRAVEFVTNPEDFAECEYVRDFEDLLDMASFARHFAERRPAEKELLPSLLARAKRYVREHFFEFTGICNEVVPCCNSSGKPLLNYECWQHVFSFLTLNVVK
ncbi:unnamed protein product [Ixodes pacificus]